MKPPGRNTYRLVFIILLTFLLFLGVVMSTEEKDLLYHSSGDPGLGGTRSSSSAKLSDSVLAASSEIAFTDQTKAAAIFKEAPVPEGDNVPSPGPTVLSKEDPDKTLVLFSARNTSGEVSRIVEDSQKVSGSVSPVIVAVDIHTFSTIKPTTVAPDDETSTITSSFSVTGTAPMSGDEAVQKRQNTQLDNKNTSQSDKVTTDVTADPQMEPKLLNDLTASNLQKTSLLSNAIPNATDTNVNVADAPLLVRESVRAIRNQPNQTKSATEVVEILPNTDPTTTYAMDSATTSASVSGIEQNIDISSIDQRNVVPKSQVSVEGVSLHEPTGSPLDSQGKTSRIIIYIANSPTSLSRAEGTPQFADSANDTTGNLSSSSIQIVGSLSTSTAAPSRVAELEPTLGFPVTAVGVQDNGDAAHESQNVSSHRSSARNSTGIIAGKIDPLLSLKNVRITKANRDVHSDDTKPDRTLAPVFTPPNEGAGSEANFSGKTDQQPSGGSESHSQPSSTTDGILSTTLHNDSRASVAAIASAVTTDSDRSRTGAVAVPLMHFGGQRFIEFGVVRTRRGPRILTNHILTKIFSKDIQASSGKRLTNPIEVRKEAKSPRTGHYKSSRPLALVSGTLLRMPGRLVPGLNGAKLKNSTAGTQEGAGNYQRNGGSAEFSAELLDEGAPCRKDRTRRKRKVFKPKPVPPSLASMFEFRRLPKKRANPANSLLPKTLAEARASNSSEATEAPETISRQKKIYDEFLQNVLRNFGVQIEVIPIDKTSNGTKDAKDREVCSDADCNAGELRADNKTHVVSGNSTASAPATVPVLSIIPPVHAISKPTDDDIVYRTPMSVVNQRSLPMHISISEDELSVPAKPSSLGAPSKSGKHGRPTSINKLQSSGRWTEKYSSKGHSVKPTSGVKSDTDGTKSSRPSFTSPTSAPLRVLSTTKRAPAFIDVNDPPRETVTIDLGKVIARNTDRRRLKSRPGTVELTPGKVYIHDLDSATFEEAPDEDGTIARNLAARKKYEDEFVQNVLRNFGVQLGDLDSKTGVTKDGTLKIDRVSPGERGLRPTVTAPMQVITSSLPSTRTTPILSGTDLTTSAYPPQQVAPPQPTELPPPTTPTFAVDLNPRPAIIDYVSHLTQNPAFVNPPPLLPPNSLAPQIPQALQHLSQLPNNGSVTTQSQVYSSVPERAPVPDEVILGRSKEALPPEITSTINKQGNPLNKSDRRTSGGLQASTLQLNHSGGKIQYGNIHPSLSGYVPTILHATQQTKDLENPHPFLVSYRPHIPQNIQLPKIPSAVVSAPLIELIQSTNAIQAIGQAQLAPVPTPPYSHNVDIAAQPQEPGQLVTQRPEAIRVIPSPNLARVEVRALPTDHGFQPRNLSPQQLVQTNQQLPSSPVFLDQHAVPHVTQQVIVNQQPNLPSVAQPQRIKHISTQPTTFPALEDQVVVNQAQRQIAQTQHQPLSAGQFPETASSSNHLQPSPLKVPQTTQYIHTPGNRITEQISLIPFLPQQTVLQGEQLPVAQTAQPQTQSKGPKADVEQVQLTNQQQNYHVSQAALLEQVEPQDEKAVTEQAPKNQHEQVQQIQLPQQQINIQQEAPQSSPELQLPHSVQSPQTVQYQLSQQPNSDIQPKFSRVQLPFSLKFFKSAQKTPIESSIYANNAQTFTSSLPSTLNSPAPFSTSTYVLRDGRLQKTSTGLLEAQIRPAYLHSPLLQNSLGSGHSFFEPRPLPNLSSSLNFRPASTNYFPTSNPIHSSVSPFGGFHITHSGSAADGGATAFSSIRPDINGILSDVYSTTFNPAQQTRSSFRLNFGYRTPQSSTHSGLESVGPSTSAFTINSFANGQDTFNDILSRIPASSSTGFYQNLSAVRSSISGASFEKPSSLTGASNEPPSQSALLLGPDLSNVEMKSNGSNEYTGYIKKSKAKARRRRRRHSK
ncbi:hypothetical protein BIW11_08834 [Tropilaelaps mercedesae]|uniref:Uncharacterized protein n=1 Tax=Tropilaelaps mercedesae TaxID=418985 RepID=A0A1V9XMT9_9ACAR|nr:hypothetical protein BIW11_08834 [Tropilaelaps mercedesae]